MLKKLQNFKHLNLFRLLLESSSLLADWYFENSQPIIAACCHLAVNDVQVGLIHIYYCLKNMENYKSYILYVSVQKKTFCHYLTSILFTRARTSVLHADHTNTELNAFCM